MTEADVPAAVQITNEAFRLMFKHLLGHVPPGRAEGDRVAKRFFHPAVKSMVLRDAEGVVQGAAFVHIFGTRSLGGPIAISSRLRAPYAAHELIMACTRLSAESGCRVMDSATFSHSPQHFLFHWRRGGDPTFPAVWMLRPLHAPPVLKTWDTSSIVVTRYSSLSEQQQSEARRDMRRVTETYEPGYDLSSEAQFILAQGIGETYLAALNGRIVGFATTQRGPGSEAFMDEEVHVKFLFVDTSIPFTSASSAFHALLDMVEEDARKGGFQVVTATVSGGRRASVSAMLDRGCEPISIMTEYPEVHRAPEWHQGRADIHFTSPTQFALAELR
jgi:hypothetical protein